MTKKKKKKRALRAEAAGANATYQELGNVQGRWPSAGGVEVPPTAAEPSAGGSAESTAAARVIERFSMSGLRCAITMRSATRYSIEVFKGTSPVHAMLVSIDGYGDPDELLFDDLAKDAFVEVEGEDAAVRDPIPREESPHSILLREGKVPWQKCGLIREESVSKYETKWHLLCPACERGTVVRYKDATPGFRESSMESCDVCGLDGDGSYFLLSTVRSAGG